MPILYTMSEGPGLATTPSEMGIPAFIPGAVERRGIATRFRPGSTPNPGGRPKSAKFRREFVKQLRMEVAEGTTRLACIADGMIDKAMQDVAAATFIRDTVDGKPSVNDGDRVRPNDPALVLAIQNLMGDVTVQSSDSVVNCNSLESAVTK